MNEKEKAIFLRYLRTGKVADARAMLEGGLLVSEAMSDRIAARVASLWPLVRLANHQSINRQRARVPVVTNDATIDWLAEGSTYQSGDEPAFTVKEFFLYRAGGLVSVSEELVEDSFYDIETFLTESFARSLGLTLETAFISGNGVNKPRGITLDAEPVAAGGSAVTIADLAGLFEALPVELLNSSAWLVNRETYAKLAALSDAAGGRAFTLDLSGNSAGLLFGRPVHITLLPPEKPVVYGDLSFYQIVDNGQSVLNRYNEISAQSGLVTFRLKQRVDAKLTRSDAVKVLEIGG